ncbi:hypothetical protein EI94DRAFT_1696109 [Lactarius quietus]|nr:hypothetical protein EI94DRAFT_1696109 [Lactarius quietus]
MTRGANVVELRQVYAAELDWLCAEQMGLAAVEAEKRFEVEVQREANKLVPDFMPAAEDQAKNMALAVALPKMCAQGEVLAKAMAQAEYDVEFETHAADACQAAKDKIELQINNEMVDYRWERYTTIQLHVDLAILNEEIDFVRSAAIHLGIIELDDLARVPPAAKKAKGTPRLVTEMKATEAKRGRASSIMGTKQQCDVSPTCSITLSRSSSIALSPCAAAGDDKATLTNSPVVEKPALLVAPTRSINIEVPACDIRTSLHNPANCMEDDDGPLPPMNPPYLNAPGPIVVSGLGMGN